ncbi:MAG: hypothetical protein AABZ60_09210, partial [Planctomycetota bacterium]
SCWNYPQKSKKLCWARDNRPKNITGIKRFGFVKWFERGMPLKTSEKFLILIIANILLVL